MEDIANFVLSYRATTESRVARRLVVLTEFVATFWTVVEYGSTFVRTAKLKGMEIHLLIATAWALFLDRRLLHRLHVRITSCVADKLSLLAQDRWEGRGMRARHNREIVIN